MGNRSILTSYQRHQASGKREAHRFRKIVERLIGEDAGLVGNVLDQGGSQLKILAALEVEYRSYLEGGKVTRASILRHLQPGGTPESSVFLSELEMARG